LLDSLLQENETDKKIITVNFFQHEDGR